MAHRNAALNVHGRILLCERIGGGWPVAHAAEALGSPQVDRFASAPSETPSKGISRQCAYKWWRRYGPGGLGDRSSRPRSSPTRTPRRVEERICRVRRADKLGPARRSGRVGVPASTVHRVLVRHDLSRLDRIDRPTGRVIRRYERAKPGELIHVDIKKLGKVPPGGGHRRLGRFAARRNKRARIGYHYIHNAVDDHSRLAYSEILADEKGVTAAGFWRRAQAWFAARGVIAERVMTDNGKCYTGRLFNAALDEGTISHRYTRPYRSQTNGNVERFNRTLLEEWAYVHTYTRDAARNRAFQPWIHRYNHHRGHTALNGHPPITRVTNVPGPYTYFGGIWIIEAPDLDVALELAAEGSKHCNRKIEVRPFL